MRDDHELNEFNSLEIQCYFAQQEEIKDSSYLFIVHYNISFK